MCFNGNAGYFTMTCSFNGVLLNSATSRLAQTLLNELISDLCVCRGGQVLIGPSAMSESSVGKSIMDCWLLCGCTGTDIKKS